MSYNKITPETFNLIKRQTNNKVYSVAEIARLFNTTVSTVYNIRRAENYKQYRTTVTRKLQTLNESKEADQEPQPGEKYFYSRLETLDDMFTRLNIAMMFAIANFVLLGILFLVYL